MSEVPLRQSTRPRKPRKFPDIGDNDYGVYGQAKFSEVRDSISSAQQTNQLAKLLVKFLSSANLKAKDIQKDDTSQHPPTGSALDYQRSRNISARKQDTRNHNFSSETPLPALKPHRDPDRQPAQSSRLATRPYNKKVDPSKKEKMGMPASIESDLSYHTMLGQHIRSNLPDSRNLSTEMLMQLGLPSREALEQGKVKEQEKKKRVVTGDVKRGGEQRQQLKPFKRQSYHVAIAYHIFLQKVKVSANPSTRDIDPTYHARRLREQNQRQE